MTTETQKTTASGLPCNGCLTGNGLRAFGGYCVDCALARIDPFDPASDSARDADKDPHAEVARILASEIDLTDERSASMVLVLASAIEDIQERRQFCEAFARKLNQQLSVKIDAMTVEEIAEALLTIPKCVDCGDQATCYIVGGVPTLCDAHAPWADDEPSSAAIQAKRNRDYVNSIYP